MRMFLGSAANIYFSAETHNNGEQAIRSYPVCAEIIMMGGEPDYRIDGGKVVKFTNMETYRTHIHLDGLRQYIDSLEELHSQMERLSVEHDQALAGDSQDQLTLDLQGGKNKNSEA